MATLSSVLALTLTPYAQPVPVAPYSLKSADTRSLVRLQARAESPRAEAPSGGLNVGPLLSFGLEFLRGSKAPFTLGGVGLQLIHKNFRFKALPEFMISTGTHWESSSFGGRGYRFTFGMDIDLGPIVLQPALKMTGHSKRGLGDPEKRTELDQEASEAYLVRASYQPTEGLYLSAQYAYWNFSEVRIKSPGLNLRFDGDQVSSTELAAGCSWAERRVSVKWLALAGVENFEEHGYRARGMMDDMLLHKQKLEAEISWLF